MAKPGKYRDASNTLRSGEVGKYFKYYDEELGRWFFHLLDEDLTISVDTDELDEVIVYIEDVPFAAQRGAPPGARYDDTHILRRMAQIHKASGEDRPRRLAILAVSQMKPKLIGGTRESVIKRLAGRWKNFCQK